MESIELRPDSGSNVVHRPQSQENAERPPSPIDESPSPPTKKHFDFATHDPLPRAKLRLAMANYSNFVLGIVDASQGSVLLSMQVYYGVEYQTLSYIFLTIDAGYFLATFALPYLISRSHMRLVTLLGSFVVSVAMAVISVAPPFGLLVAIFVALGFGEGILESAMGSHVAHFEDTVMMNVHYSLYGLGAFVAPLVVSAFIAHDIPWQRYYLFPLAISIVEMGIQLYAFWNYEAPPQIHTGVTPQQRSKFRLMLKKRVMWVGSFVAFLAFGLNSTIGAWLVTYLSVKRRGSDTETRYITAGFYAGVTLGRSLLAYPVSRNPKVVCAVFLALIVACQLIAWLCTSIKVDAVFEAFIGFFLGPMFPTVLSLVTEGLDRASVPFGVSFMVCVGLTGNALLPFLVGQLASHLQMGIGVLQPVTLACMLVMTGAWLLMPSRKKTQ
ncbi:hypothetical protein G7K_2692-t1 [Saitoella complicata NRRL Y-17804]|uniref:Major facilitator superfamily (MFS) profile domain-containing protein n=2 Tax=Saitoella complicata (strain BCRC 22490 / CBS 7301 / JCM 7358 / NBRC 10748 / NRRL Y-17804) TaxID=698492 RepID=A0A0E9NFA2_SAICN|nr:hypothetical protein G7K_2692-t1 [Saitoella complicata NRRL Y-17804]